MAWFNNYSANTSRSNNSEEVLIRTTLLRHLTGETEQKSDELRPALIKGVEAVSEWRAGSRPGSGAAREREEDAGSDERTDLATSLQGEGGYTDKIQMWQRRTIKIHGLKSLGIRHPPFLDAEG